MKMTVALLGFLLLLAGCCTPTQNVRLAAKIFDMKFDPATKTVEVANLTGLKTDNDLFSHRNDSRTYFLYDAARASGTAPHFSGTDEELLALAAGVLKRAHIPKDEVAKARVLQEQNGVGAFDRTTHAITDRKESKGKRYALLTREIQGVPVVSSRLLMTTGYDKRASFAELHWPIISKEVLREAKLLQSLVREGWEAPEERAARPETIEAVIVHSPAMATVMDVHAVIRVIYKPVEARVTMKVQRYFDANGRPVEPPRTFAKMPDLGSRKRESRENGPK